MRKFPDVIATKQDVENILNNHPEYHNKLKSVLMRAVNEPETSEQVVGYDVDPDTREMTNVMTETIVRPNQTWERMGFTNRDELNTSLQKCEVGKSGLQMK